MENKHNANIKLEHLPVFSSPLPHATSLSSVHANFGAVVLESSTATLLQTQELSRFPALPSYSRLFARLDGLRGGHLTSPVSTEQALRPEQLRKSREPLATLPFLPPQTLALFTPKLARIGGNKDAMSGWRGSTRHGFRVAAHSSFPFLDAPSLCGIYDRYSAALSPWLMTKSIAIAWRHSLFASSSFLCLPSRARSRSALVLWPLQPHPRS